MKNLVAVSAGIILLAYAIPSTGQTSGEEARRPYLTAAMQAPSQVSNASTTPGEQKLTAEQMGDLYMARKDYREAAVAYRRLSLEHPDNAVYLNKLGIALHQQEALSLALKCYERAVKVDPTYADARNNIGTIWYQRKRYSKAVRAYQKAIGARADMAVLYSNLGYAYFGEKKYAESIAAFRTALEKDPQFFEHNSSRGGSILQDRTVGDRGRFYFLLAKSFAEMGDVDRCVLYLRKAKEEGYKAMSDVKKDPAFASLVKLPAVQEVLSPKPPESEQP